MGVMKSDNINVPKKPMRRWLPQSPVRMQTVIGMGLELAEIKDRSPLRPCSVHRVWWKRTKVAAPRSGC